MNTYDLVQYYAKLLILQYVGKRRAYATIETVVRPVIMPQVSVQEITFPLIPGAGSFVLSWGGDVAAAINWNDSAAVIQSKLRDLAPEIFDGGDAFSTGSEDIDGGDTTTVFSEDIDGGDAFGFSLSHITVTGSIASGTLVVTFLGVGPPPVAPLMLVSSTLTSSAIPVNPVITETDTTLPVAVQNAYNVTGDAIAEGVQLDVIGKYAGVTRRGDGFTVPITLDDADFASLIQMAIIKNSAGSSMATIVGLVHQFFGAAVQVYDYQNMQMSYLISTSVGSRDLIELFITEGVLPAPMAVAVSVIYYPVITDFFGFRTYQAASVHNRPFNDYASYQTDWPWLSYAFAFTP